MEKITFTGEDGVTEELFVLSNVKLAGVAYLLVTDSEEGDGEAFIFKDTSDSADAQSTYEEVTDDAEFAAVAKLFQEDLGDEVELM